MWITSINIYHLGIKTENIQKHLLICLKKRILNSLNVNINNMFMENKWHCFTFFKILLTSDLIENS